MGREGTVNEGWRKLLVTDAGTTRYLGRTMHAGREGLETGHFLREVVPRVSRLGEKKRESKWKSWRFKILLAE